MLFLDVIFSVNFIIFNDIVLRIYFVLNLFKKNAKSEIQNK